MTFIGRGGAIAFTEWKPSAVKQFIGQLNVYTNRPGINEISLQTKRSGENQIFGYQSERRYDGRAFRASDKTRAKTGGNQFLCGVDVETKRTRAQGRVDTGHGDGEAKP